MHFSTALLATLATTLTFASPTPLLLSRQATTTTTTTAAASSSSSSSPINASFSITNYNFFCSPGGCIWDFDVSIPSIPSSSSSSSSNSTTISPPSFSPVSCWGTTYQTSYVSCANISSTRSVSAWINSSSDPMALHLEYQALVTVEDEQQQRWNYYGEQGVGIPAHCDTCPRNFSVPITAVTAVA